MQLTSDGIEAMREFLVVKTLYEMMKRVNKAKATAPALDWRIPRADGKIIDLPDPRWMKPWKR